MLGAENFRIELNFFKNADINFPVILNFKNFRQLPPGIEDLPIEEQQKILQVMTAALEDEIAQQALNQPQFPSTSSYVPEPYDHDRSSMQKTPEPELTEEELDQIRRVAERAMQDEIAITERMQKNEIEKVRRMSEAGIFPDIKSPAPERTEQLVEDAGLSAEELEMIRMVNERAAAEEALFVENQKQQPTMMKDEPQELTAEELEHIRRITEMAAMDSEGFAQQQQRSSEPIKMIDIARQVSDATESPDSMRGSFEEEYDQANERRRSSGHKFVIDERDFDRESEATEEQDSQRSSPPTEGEDERSQDYDEQPQYSDGKRLSYEHANEIIRPELEIDYRDFDSRAVDGMQNEHAERSVGMFSSIYLSEKQQQQDIGEIFWDRENDEAAGEEKREGEPEYAIRKQEKAFEEGDLSKEAKERVGDRDRVSSSQFPFAAQQQQQEQQHLVPSNYYDSSRHIQTLELAEDNNRPDNDIFTTQRDELREQIDSFEAELDKVQMPTGSERARTDGEVPVSSEEHFDEEEEEHKGTRSTMSSAHSRQSIGSHKSSDFDIK